MTNIWNNNYIEQYTVQPNYVLNYVYGLTLI